MRKRAVKELSEAEYSAILYGQEVKPEDSGKAVGTLPPSTLEDSGDKSEGWTQNELSKRLQVSDRTIRNYLEKLRQIY